MIKKIKLILNLIDIKSMLINIKYLNLLSNNLKVKSSNIFRRNNQKKKKEIFYPKLKLE